MVPRPNRWLIGVSVLVALVGLVVWLVIRSSVPDVSPATAEALEAAADSWWRPGGHGPTIPEAEWPPEVRRLGPETVHVTAEGVYFQFSSFFVESCGLFVLPAGSTFDPLPNGDPSYQLLRGRVYRYDIAG